MAAQGTTQSITIGLDFGTTYSGSVCPENSYEIPTRPKAKLPCCLGNCGRATANRGSIYMARNKFQGAYSNGFYGNSLSLGMVGSGLATRANSWCEATARRGPGYRYSPSLRAKRLLDFTQKSPVDVSAEYLQKLTEHDSPTSGTQLWTCGQSYD
ncbi:hypothetical protein TSTA_123390 [Talaromyces stipitatus ATCC 10500]|uniref:Uncharacterized protein n=1 Tax=Talaromyces stipitatus (strain ATCC 10500 / CBS 375.48 / QM 6759 / NRRL 1006) TaxID=441959 RepID=B8MAA4_TALSN|nr:uncharacterized protein TSTA_123390 [Talaromyces stipitatus ATCC 10500]EED18606.1 hypothetical protein TSTA_123390 [Talaromyces stipitatus ATCC 10500]